MKNKPSRKKYVRKYSIDRKNTITRKKYAGYNPNSRLPENIENIMCEDIDKKVTGNNYWKYPNMRLTNTNLNMRLYPQIKKCNIRYKNGDFYQGNFDTLKNIKIGHGVMNYNNDDRYDGEWKNDKKEGQGTMMYHTGDTYNGAWVNDKKYGKGKMDYRENYEIIDYDGNWKDDLKHGEGKITYNKDGIGIVIKGNWENDQMVPTKSRKSTTTKPKPK